MESRVRREDHARTGRIHVRRVEPVRVARVDGEDADAAGLSVVVVDARPRSAGRDTGVPPELIAAEAHRPLVADAGLDVESRRTRPARGVGDADRTGIRRATGQLCPDDAVRRDVRRDVDATRREDHVLLIGEPRDGIARAEADDRARRLRCRGELTATDEPRTGQDEERPRTAACRVEDAVCVSREVEDIATVRVRPGRGRRARVHRAPRAVVLKTDVKILRLGPRTMNARHTEEPGRVRAHQRLLELRALTGRRHIGIAVHATVGGEDHRARVVRGLRVEHEVAEVVVSALRRGCRDRPLPPREGTDPVVRGRAPAAGDVRGAASAEEAHVAVPEIEDVVRADVGALVRHDEGDPALRDGRHVELEGPRHAAVVGLEDADAGHTEEHVRLIGRDRDRAGTEWCAAGADRTTGPRRAAVGRAEVTVVAADVNDPLPRRAAALNDDVPDVAGRGERCRVDEPPGHTRVVADRNTAVGPDEDVVRGARLDADAHGRRLGDARGGAAESGGRVRSGRCRGDRMRPRRAAIGAHVDPGEADNAPVIEGRGVHALGAARVDLDVPRCERLVTGEEGPVLAAVGRLVDAAPLRRGVEDLVIAGDRREVVHSPAG